MNSELINIAIIEDDLTIGTIIKMQLEKIENYKVELFSSGEDYFDRNKKFDLLIIDYNLDSYDKYASNGLEVIKKIENTPAIIMSSQNELETTIELINNGACDYVIKNNDLYQNILSSVSNIADHIKENKEIATLKTKKKKDFMRMTLMISLMIAFIYISTR